MADDEPVKEVKKKSPAEDKPVTAVPKEAAPAEIPAEAPAVKKTAAPLEAPKEPKPVPEPVEENIGMAIPDEKKPEPALQPKEGKPAPPKAEAKPSEPASPKPAESESVKKDIPKAEAKPPEAVSPKPAESEPVKPKAEAKPPEAASPKPAESEPVKPKAEAKPPEAASPKPAESEPAKPKAEAKPEKKMPAEPENPAPQPKVIGIPPDKLLLFDKYDMSEVTVTDAGLARYINLDPVMVPHTGAKHANRSFAKSKMNIVERLVNNMMRTENYTGKKTKTYNVVMNAFAIIESKTKKNPVQVFIDALENTTPREEVTRLRYGGVSVPKAVDVSSSRRLDIALRNISRGAVSATYKNTKSIEVCLANELMLAAKGDMNSAAISKKEEVERIASSAR